MVMISKASYISVKNHVCILLIAAGATQVRWNRLSRYLLATAHDGDIKLWDQRKGTAPVQYIAAHLAKVGTYFAVFLFIAYWQYYLLNCLEALACGIQVGCQMETYLSVVQCHEC
jgi:hypothetical protein